MKKLLALLLALLALLPLAVACAESETPASQTTASNDTEMPEETADPTLDDVPAGLDYQERTFTIAGPQPWSKDYFNVEEDDGDTIHSAIYSRNRQIEARFNITVDAINLDCWSNNIAAGFSTYQLSGEDVIDLLAVTYYESSAPLILAGAVLPWNDVAYIDLNKEYWNKQATETLNVLGNYYYLSGSINWNYMGTTMAVYFNKEVTEKYGDSIGDLYQEVRDGKWTWDQMNNYAKVVATDLDSNGMDINDQWGLIQYQWTMDTHIYGAGYNTVYINDKDGVVLNINTDKLMNIIQKVDSIFHKDKIAMYSPDTALLDSIFFDDRALFYITTLEYSAPFRQYDSDFGILPPPKYDEAQKSYHSHSDQWGLAMGLPSTASDTERTGAITEALCSLSHRTVIPAYYERTLLGKIKRDDESEEMLDIIFKNVHYDLGITFITDTSLSVISGTVFQQTTHLTSWYRKNESKLRSNYEQLLEYVEKYNEEHA